MKAQLQDVVFNKWLFAKLWLYEGNIIYVTTVRYILEIVNYDIKSHNYETQRDGHGQQQ